MRALQSFLLGEWRTGHGRSATLVNPATSEPLAEVATEGLPLVEALEHARRDGGPALRAMSFAERGALLDRMRKRLEAAREDLIGASIANAGTTRSDAKFDVDGAIATLAFYAELGASLGERRFTIEGDGEGIGRSARFWGRHVRVPLEGAAVHVNAFNFPAWGLAEKAAVALLAGMPVLSKPATSTALTAVVAMEALARTDGLPPGTLQLVCGGVQPLLDALGPQDVLAFTGSGATAAILRRLAAVVERSTRVNVEADSLNATVLAPDAEPGSETYGAFVGHLVKEVTQKTGQKCTATRRAFVPRAWIDRVQADVVERLSEVKVGDPSDREVTMGPLATAQQREDVRAGVARLERGGARRVLGDPLEVALVGEADRRGYFFGPVVLRADAPAEARAVHEHEVFGPVVTLMPYDEPEEAARLVAMGEGGLVASVYGDDRDTLRTLVLALAPHHGRLLVGSRKVADAATAPGLVLPGLVHGGPGRAGGGEELGGERGLALYTQRCALQGDRALLDKLLTRG